MASSAVPALPDSKLGHLRLMSPSSGLRLSPLQYGAMSLGQGWESMLGNIEKEKAFSILDTFYKNGGNIVDTASVYQNEQSEEWVGEWMAERGIRDEMVIATKYGSAYKSYDIGVNRGANMTGNHRKSMHVQIRDSLKKLRTDYVDIYYLHWWDYTTPVKEIMDSLHALVESGKVLYLGISDTPAWIVAKANQYAIENGKTPFSIYQGKWSVMIRDMERDIVPMCKDFGMAIAPWGAVGEGRLLTKQQLAERKASGEGFRYGKPAEQTKEEEAMSEVLGRLADKYKVSALTTIALAYLFAKTPYVFPIVGGRKVEHLLENIESLDIKLTADEVKEIEDVIPFDHGFPYNFFGRDPHDIGGKPEGNMETQLGPINYLPTPAPY